MTYVKQTWANNPAGGTPISAARLNYIEDGIEAVASGAPYARIGAGALETISRPYEFEEETTHAKGAIIDINAATYGADPLGVQEDTFIPAVQSAVAQAIAQGGGVVRARGTYLTNDGCSLVGMVPENVILDFEKARVVATAPAHFLTINDGTKIRVIGGNWENDVTLPRTFLKLNGCSDVVVEGVNHVGGGMIDCSLGVADPTARCQRIRVSDSQCDAGGVSINVFALDGDYFTIERCKAHGTTADIVKPAINLAKYVWIEGNDFFDAGDDLIDLFGYGHYFWIVRNHLHNTVKAMNLKFDVGAGTSVVHAWVADNLIEDVGTAARMLNAPSVKYRGNKHLRCGQNPGGTFAAQVTYIEGAFKDTDIIGNEYVDTKIAGAVTIRAVESNEGGQPISAREHVVSLYDNRFRGSQGHSIVNTSTSRNRVTILMRGNKHIGGTGRAFSNTATSDCTIMADGDFLDLTQQDGYRCQGTGLNHYIMRNNVVDRGVKLTVNATGGNFTVTVQGQTTANLDAATTTAATLQTALEGLSSVGGAGHLRVGGGPASASAETAFIIHFTPTGKWGLGLAKPSVSATNVSLTGGTSTVTVLAPPTATVFLPEATASVVQDGNSWNGLREGPTANRPTTNRYRGQRYWDTTTITELIWDGAAWKTVTVT